VLHSSCDRVDGGRYTSRFFLKHAYLEQAFDALLDAGFQMVSSTSSSNSVVLKTFETSRRRPRPSQAKTLKLHKWLQEFVE